MKKSKSKISERKLHSPKKKNSVLSEIALIQNDATQCLRILSEVEHSNQNAYSLMMKDPQGVSPWTKQHKEQNSPQKQQFFKKSKTSSFLPYSLKRPKKGFTQNIKNRRYKNNNSEKCKTTITRYPSEQNSSNKILILSNKENEPELCKSQRKQQSLLKQKNRILEKNQQWKNLVQSASECARLKQKIKENIQKQAVVSDYQQKPLPLPNAIKPLSRFLKKKKPLEKKGLENYQIPKQLYGKYLTTVEKWRVIIKQVK